MTVYELIEELKKMPRDYAVLVADSESCLDDDELSGTASKVVESDYFDSTVIIKF